MRGTAILPAATAGTGYAFLQLLGRTAGSTASERRRTLPGDQLVAAPQMVTDHAVTVDATAAEVWPWLTQMGWHLGGYYTPHWVDRLLFPDNWASAGRLDPRLARHLLVGDTIPDGPPGTAEYVVARADPPHVLVLTSSTHIPPGWHEKYGAEFTWSWCFHLTDQPDGRTRVHTRVRGRGAPWWFIGLYILVIVPADYVMATGMLRGLRKRVDATARGRLRDQGP
jgi:hypothetical protein